MTLDKETLDLLVDFTVHFTTKVVPTLEENVDDDIVSKALDAYLAGEA